MRLWLVRHAATALPAGVCCGRWDVPADPAATTRAADALHAVLPRSAVWRTSPLRRARQLAEALAVRRHMAPAALDPRLAEFDFGAWEGQPWEALPRAALDAWAADFADHIVGGGESVRALLTRVRSALLDTLSLGRGNDAVWITHAGVIRAVRYTAAHGWHATPTRGEDWPTAAPACGGWWAVDIDRTNRVGGVGITGSSLAFSGWMGLGDRDFP